MNALYETSPTSTSEFMHGRKFPMGPSAAKENGPGLVLVADDNPEARRMLDLRVKREGHSVILVENGAQALEVLAEQDIDVILLDIYMPEKDGFEVLSLLKRDPRYSHVPVLMISGGGDQEDLVRCIELGAIDYLSKPFNQAVLRARLSACIAAKRHRDRELRELTRPTPVPSAAATIDGSPSLMLEQNLSPPSNIGLGPELHRRLGRIRIEQQLGVGGMANVYLGHHELLDLPVAVKVLRPEKLSDAEMRARITREARLAARIGHRNVVRLLEVGETAETMYLAYEYVDGGTLEHLLNRTPERKLAIATALRITREIATGLAEINWLGITHRDVKPSNILLTRTGEVKIADLGLARYSNVSTAPSLTGEFFVVGTPLYMAPEQAEGLRSLDITCDLYALGVVLFEMLTGYPPFTGVVPMAILASHMFSPVPPVRDARPDVPDWLEAICMKLLAKSRNERFALPEALLEELQKHGA
jgi:CheY-like chemotaxis protein